MRTTLDEVTSQLGLRSSEEGCWSWGESGAGGRLAFQIDDLTLDLGVRLSMLLPS